MQVSPQIRQVLLYVGAGLALFALARFAFGRWNLGRRDRIALAILLVMGVGLAVLSRFELQHTPGQGLALVPFVARVEIQEQTNAGALEQLRTASLEPAGKSLGGPDAWPQWLGPTRNAISAETSLRTDWNRQPPTLVWKRPIGTGYSSPSIVGDRLYVTELAEGTDVERVLCLDARTGKELWSYRDPANYRTGNYAGPRASPTVHDGKVYTVGYTGHFLCLEAAPKGGQAHVLWRHDLLREFQADMPTWGVACSPLIEDRLVIVQPGGKDRSVVAFDRQTGSVVWHARSDPSGYSSPVAATAAGVRQIIAFTGAGAVGLRAENGAELWYFPWHTEYNANIATPVVVGDYVFLSSDYGTGCALLHLVAVTPAPGVRVEPVYVKANKLMRNHHMTCVVQGGYLYGCDSGRGELKCIDLRTGDEKWSDGRLGKHCLLWADGNLIVLTETGHLVLVEATPVGFREKGRINSLLQPPECWALPALAAGRLYLRDHHHILCLDLKSPAKSIPQ